MMKLRHGIDREYRQPLFLVTMICSGAMLGCFAEFHFIFLSKDSEGIPGRCIQGIVIGCLLGGILALLCRKHVLANHNRLRFPIDGFLITCLCAAGYVLFANSRTLCNDYANFLILYYILLFLLSTISIVIVINDHAHHRVIFFTIITFILLSMYISIKLNFFVGFIQASLFTLYLYFLGSFAIHILQRFVYRELPNKTCHTCLSIVFGILLNYAIVYVIGIFIGINKTVFFAITTVVMMSGLYSWKNRITELTGYGKRLTTFCFHTPSARRLDAALFAGVLVCILLLLFQLSIRYPGHQDSSARMYYATIFRFSEFGFIAFLPFSDNWTLIFQPLLMELTGIPLFVTCGISATRLFFGMFGLFILPFLLLMRVNKILSYRGVIVVFLLLLTSSFTFSMAYSDKPEVIAFPALIGCFATCLILIKESNPWYVMLAAGTATIILTAKMALFIGVILAFLLLFIIRSTMATNNYFLTLRRMRKAIVPAMVTVLPFALINPAQNSLIRGNPVHPFLHEVFPASKSYAEELHMADIPKNFYHRTMPVAMPGKVFGVNLDVDRGMYRPLVPLFGTNWPQWWQTRYSISVVVLAFSIAMPFFLVRFVNLHMLFITMMTFAGFFIWFGWIGDGLRYSSFFPAAVLMCALVLEEYRRFHSAASRVVVTMACGLLLASIPLAVSSTFSRRGDVPLEVLEYPFVAADAPEAIQERRHPVHAYLNQCDTESPLLMVTDYDVYQYGFYQPNVIFRPEYMHVAYMATLRPTHVLTGAPIVSSRLIKRFPWLRDYLTPVMDYQGYEPTVTLYRFPDDMPWEKIAKQYGRRSPHSAALRDQLQRFVGRYRSN